MKKLFILAIVVFGFTAVSFGQTAQATLSADATATVKTALTLSQTSGLSFGTFVVGSTAGVVTVDGTGTSVSGTGNAKVTDGARALFAITGPKATAINIVLPDLLSTDIELKNGAVNKMLIKAGDLTSDAPTVTTDAAGAANFYVNGKLTFIANQAGGTYNGTFPVTVNYY